MSDATKESVITAIGDNGESQIFHHTEVGLKAPATKEAWVAAMEKSGYTGHGTAWKFCETDFSK